MSKKEYRRHSILVACFAAYLMLVSITAVFAARLINYTYDTSTVIEDEFVPVKVACSVKETSSGKYTITNDSDTSVYLRFTLVSNWVSLADGGIYWLAAEPIVSGLDGSKWMTGEDGYYYCAVPLAPGESVTVTVGHKTDNAPPNHAFRAKLVAEVIQSEPITAMHEAWGVNVVPDSQGGLINGGTDNPQQGLGGTK